jgi:GNAT superfamily N-acetyltransferase
MIKRLSIFDTDEFVDIVNDAFSRELHHIGSQYGGSKRQMRITYVAMRLLQTLFKDIRDVPDIFAYYDEDGTVMGVTKLIPVNARKDHWYTEITAVRKNLQKKGVGSELKRHTVEYYTGRARRFFGNLREKNIPSLKANSRVGYRPYVRNPQFTKDVVHSESEKNEIEGFRHFKNDQKEVYDLYLRTTPQDVIKIEDKAVKDFDFGIITKMLLFLDKMRGGEDKRYVIERDGRICAYFYFEQIWLHYENLEFMIDPECEDLLDSVTCILPMISPGKHIVCYVPEYRNFERQCLIHAGFNPEDIYLRIAKVFDGD